LWWTLGERELVSGASAVHVFFDEERDHLSLLGYDGEVIVAPNGVSVPDGYRWDGSRGHLLFLGRFDPEHKGLDVLLEAIATAGPCLPPLRMHGTDWKGGKARLQELIVGLGIDDRVVLGGPLHGAQKWRAFTEAAGFVYPSRWEAFGNSAAEAAALGVPTLVTPYPLGRYLAQRGAAVLAETTASALADGLVELVSSDAALVGQRAYDLMQEEFTWDAVAESWLATMKKLA
jgi:glycosyltransferase involved in cell wall biosynthesis